jgi:hypothetical protein
MNKDRLKVKGKKFLLGCAVLAFFLGIATVVNIGDNSAAKVIVQPAQSQSQPTAAEARSTYSTESQAENTRHKAITDAISKKYDAQIKTLRDELQDYTNKGETAAATDCSYDLLILQDQQMIETSREDLTHTQDNKRIYDKYIRPASKQ